MAQSWHITAENSGTFQAVMYLPGVNLTGCTATQKLFRREESLVASYTFSASLGGITIANTTQALTIGGAEIPAGSGAIAIRWEATQTATMTGIYVHDVKLTFPIGSNPEATVWLLASGTVTINP